MQNLKKLKVLFLCTANSARSQIAQAMLERFGDDKFEAYSAGLDPSVVNPLTIEVLNEVGISMEGKVAKSVNLYMGHVKFEYLVTVCARAEERCPVTFPGISNRLHWAFDDPAKAEGTHEQKLAKFRQVRDEIRDRVISWVEGMRVPVEQRGLLNQETR